MLQKLETVLEYRLEECLIDSLIKINEDNYDCNKCEYVWRITNEGNDYVCLLDIDLDLDEVR